MAESTEWLQLQRDIKAYLPALSKAADTVVEQEVSNYPVFLAYPGDDLSTALGIAVLEAPTTRGVTWSVHVTTLEELVARQIVASEKVDNFRRVYKTTPNSICFLIWAEGESRFAFLPRPGATLDAEETDD
ncbi:MAG: hypothetical protein AAF433_13280 [Bacteroidota bacterium]